MSAVIGVIASTSSTSGPSGPLVAVPHLFTPAIVRRIISGAGPGAYALGRDDGGFVVGYVGRSDHSVRERLVAHERLVEFDYFIARSADNAGGAFQLECAFWHACLEAGRPLANIIHPGRPRGSGLECPYCHFATNVRRLLAAQISEEPISSSRWPPAASTARISSGSTTADWRSK